VIPVENLCNISYNEGVQKSGRGGRKPTRGSGKRRKLPQRDPAKNDVGFISKTKIMHFHCYRDAILMYSDIFISYIT